MKLAIIKLTDIFEGDRRRGDYGDLEELCQSIKEKGIIQPLAVGLPAGYLDTNLPYVLIAGGRRFRAASMAGLTEVPVRIYERQLNELELRSIELEENLRRKQLSWDEQLKLEREIHDLQVALHGNKISTAKDASGHSLRDTAVMLDKTPAAISQDFKLHKAMQEFPDLGWEQCKNKNEANKLLNKVAGMFDTRVRSADAAEKLAVNGGAKQHLADAYIIGDCFNFLPKLSAGMFDLVEVDPPYGINLQEQKKDYNYEDYNEIESAKYVEFLNRLLPHLYRVMAPNSWMVFWFAPEPWFEDVFQAIDKAGFKVNRMCGIWTKGYGQTNAPMTRLGNSYEMFFYASKGNPELAKPGHINTFNYSPVSPEKKTHPTERPIELMQEVLRTFAKPNAKVLVPFAGSGVTLRAAVKEQMIPLGYDLSQPFKDAHVIKVQEEF